MGQNNAAANHSDSNSTSFSSGFPPVIRVGQSEVVYEIRIDSDEVRRAVVDDSRRDTAEGLLWRDVESQNTLRGFRVRGWRLP